MGMSRCFAVLHCLACWSSADAHVESLARSVPVQVSSSGGQSMTRTSKVGKALDGYRTSIQVDSNGDIKDDQSMVDGSAFYEEPGPGQEFGEPAPGQEFVPDVVITPFNEEFKFLIENNWRGAFQEVHAFCEERGFLGGFPTATKQRQDGSPSCFCVKGASVKVEEKPCPWCLTGGTYPWGKNFRMANKECGSGKAAWPTGAGIIKGAGRNQTSQFLCMNKTLGFMGKDSIYGEFDWTAYGSHWATAMESVNKFCKDKGSPGGFPTGSHLDSNITSPTKEVFCLSQEYVKTVAPTAETTPAPEVITTAAPAETTPAPRQCMPGWKFGDGLCYKFTLFDKHEEPNAKEKWVHEQAELNCEGMSSEANNMLVRLAVIHSDAANTVVAELVGNYTEVHIGLKYKDEVGLVWENGEPAEYQAKWNNETDTVGECTRISGSDAHWNPSGWDDWPCATPLRDGYVCSYNPLGKTAGPGDATDYKTGGGYTES